MHLKGVIPVAGLVREFVHILPRISTCSNQFDDVDSMI